MRSIFSVLRTVLSVLSLLLCLATALLWARSYLVCDTVSVRHRQWHRQPNSAVNPDLIQMSQSDYGLSSSGGGLHLGTCLSEWAYPNAAYLAAHHPGAVIPFAWTHQPAGGYPGGRPDWRRLGINWGRLEMTGEPVTGVVRRWVIFPHAALILPLAVLPLAWGLRWHARRRRQWRRDHGLCPTCGYDLRVATARCPECGTSAPTPTALPPCEAEWTEID